MGSQSNRHNLVRQALALEPRPREKPRVFFLLSVLCHCLLYFALQDIPLQPPSTFEPVKIKLVELPDREFFREAVSARTLASRQTQGNPTGVLRQPFAWELTEELQPATSPKLRARDLPPTEVPQGEDGPVMEARLPEQAITMPTIQPPENDAALRVSQLLTVEPEPAQQRKLPPVEAPQREDRPITEARPPEQTVTVPPIEPPENDAALRVSELPTPELEPVQHKEVLVAEAPQREDRPVTEARLPEQTVTMPYRRPPEDDATLQVSRLPTPELEPLQQEARPDPLGPPDEPSAATLPYEPAERLENVPRRAQHLAETKLAPRAFRTAKLRATPPVHTSEAPARDESLVSTEWPQAAAVSPAKEQDLPQPQASRRVLRYAAAEPAPVHRRHAVKVVVGTIVSLAEADAGSSFAPVTSPGPRLADASEREFTLFISIRNEGTAPLMMRDTKGLFAAASPDLDDLAEWGDAWEEVAGVTAGRFSAPEYSRYNKPTYPRIARERDYEGKVVMRVEVLANGKVGEVILQESSGYKILDRSAMKAVRRWQFYPAKKNGVPTDHWTIITVEFRLVQG